MSSWKSNPIAFEPKREAAKTSWWASPDMQIDRAKFQARVVANEIDNLNKRTSQWTHDKFPKPQK
jgi:hypothetical protein